VQGTEIVLRIALPEPPPIEEPEADTEDDDIEAEELRPDDGAQTVMMAVLGVRTRAPKRKASPFSNLVRMVFEEPPPTPTGLVLEAGQDGIRLAWQAPEEGRRFNVYRRRPGAVDFGQPIALIRSSELHSHLDDTAIFGRRYEYGVTAVATGIPPVQSEVSDTAELEYLDTFAPSAPQDVVALIEGGRIRLLWSPVSANDLLGYRIYRSTGGGDSELRTEPPVTTVDWSDEEVAAGVTYIYRVTAVDREGNESDGSEGVTAIAR
jgi:fibronectin type 3 domain-containing protein